MNDQLISSPGRHCIRSEIQLPTCPLDLPKRWTPRVDRIVDPDGRLLTFLCSVTEDYESRDNLSQHIMFSLRIVDVLYPMNVDAVLSLNCKGRHLPIEIS